MRFNSKSVSGQVMVEISGDDLVLPKLQAGVRFYTVQPSEVVVGSNERAILAKALMAVAEIEWLQLGKNMLILYLVPGRTLTEELKLAVQTIVSPPVDPSRS